MGSFTKMRTPKLNPVTRAALAVLTRDWQPLPVLRLAAARFNSRFPDVSGFGPTSGTWGFSDLVEFGRAEVKREPIEKDGHARGERTYYRRKD